MLAKANRVRISTDFSRTVRSGARSGRRNVVLYAAATRDVDPTRVGFIVGKNVGNAVTRNLVKRRLREAAAHYVSDHPHGIDLVVRALPASAAAGWNDISMDFEKAVAAATRRLTTSPNGKDGGRAS